MQFCGKTSGMFLKSGCLMETVERYMTPMQLFRVNFGNVLIRNMPFVPYRATDASKVTRQ